MIENHFLKALLYTEWISWIIHFAMFFVLARWSGIRWAWALALVFAVEVWETADWSPARPLDWWRKADTWMNILFGALAVVSAEWMRRTARPEIRN